MSRESFVHIVPPGSSCRVAILGFGTVGAAVAHRLTGPDAVRGLELTHICDRRADTKRGALPEQSGVAWTTSVDDVLTSDADVIVETIGGLDPAHEFALIGLAGLDCHLAALKPREGAFRPIEPQAGLPTATIRTMARETMFRQDRPYLAHKVGNASGERSARKR